MSIATSKPIQQLRRRVKGMVPHHPHQPPPSKLKRVLTNFAVNELVKLFRSGVSLHTTHTVV